MHIFLLSGLLLKSLVAAAALSFPVSAQASGSDPVCMSSTINEHTVIFPIPATSQAEMEAKGYTAVVCNGDQASEAGVSSHRDRICQLAQMAPESVRAKFTNTYGAAPAQLCAMANELLSNQGGS